MTKKDKNWRGTRAEGGITNQDRANRAEEFLSLYMTGVDGDLHPHPEDARSYCADLIADLLHLSASNGWGAESVAQLADTNFQAER